MKADLEELEHNKVRLKIEVPPKDVASAIKRAYQRLAGEVKVPGFRQGRVPPRVIDLRVGKGSVYQEALKEMIPDYYAKAIQDSGIEPIDQPDLEVTQIEEDKPLIFEAKVQVKPKVKLGSYKGVEIEEPRVTVGKEEVSGQLEMLRDRFAKLEVVTRAFKEGDFALVNVDAQVDGKQVAELSTKDFLVGSGVLGLEFEKQLEDAKKGEIRDIWVEAPPDHGVAKVAGKKIKYRVLVKEVKTKVLPELTDDFTKDVSEFDTVAALKRDLKKRIKKLKESETIASLQGELLGKVSEEAELEVPPSMIDDEAEHIFKEFVSQLQSTRGMTLQEYLAASNDTEQGLKQRLGEEAIPRVRQQLVLDAIASAEKIEASSKELDEEIKLMAHREGVAFDEYKKVLEEKDKIDMIKYGLVMRATVDWLWDHRKVVTGAEQKAAKDKEKAGKKGAKDKSKAGKSPAKALKKQTKSVKKKKKSPVESTKKGGA